ncbi:DUF998 domain-containing protein [Streptomyces sp. NPDC048416]|uniref:DUF998 domain-containing protein n=1 Tax=Streptomyces sp. NPDC048416 TaxID=3365546 RepID=UPI00371912E3
MRHRPAAVGVDAAARPAAGRRRAAFTLLVVASVVYNDWLLEFLVPTGLDPANSYVSETFAADQPHRVLFSGIELTCAALLVAAALCMYGESARTPARAGWVAIGAFGGFSTLDVMVPMRCAPSLGGGCEAVNPWHTTTSGLVHFALFASMALFVADARRRNGVSHGPVHRWGPWLLLFSMAAALATVGPLFGHPGGQGVAQRLHLLTVGLWFLLLAAGLRPRAVSLTDEPGSGPSAAGTGTPAPTSTPAPTRAGRSATPKGVSRRGLGGGFRGSR